MTVEKTNKMFLNRSKNGSFQVFFNADGRQFRATLYPNINDNHEITGWGGNIYDNSEEETKEQE